MRMVKATVGIAALTAVLGLACGSSLPSGPQADGEGIGGSAGTVAGTAGSAGTSAIGGAGGCDLRGRNRELATGNRELEPGSNLSTGESGIEVEIDRRVTPGATDS